MYSKVEQRSRRCLLVELDSAGDFSDTPEERWNFRMKQTLRPKAQVRRRASVTQNQARRADSLRTANNRAALVRLYRRRRVRLQSRRRS